MQSASSKLIHKRHKRKFLIHLSRNICFAFIILVISLIMGILGYRHFEHMSWTDAYVNAAMILSGMGPLGTLQTMSGKIFAGSYALFSGAVFLILFAFILSPIIHWIFIKFHIENKDIRS